MKLIFIHIPKTAGSSISRALERSHFCGTWLENGALSLLPKCTPDLDFLSGHFTRLEFDEFARESGFSLNEIRFMTVIRHPLDQLLSNLSFPFELLDRNVEIKEKWMLDFIKLNISLPSSFLCILNSHPWLLNMQWQYVVTGLSLNEALRRFDYIAVFPDSLSSINYALGVLGSPFMPKEEVHINKSKKKYIDKNIFRDVNLKKLILDKHELDFKLYTEVLERKLSSVGLSDVLRYIPRTPLAIYDEWME